MKSQTRISWQTRGNLIGSNHLEKWSSAWNSAYSKDDLHDPKTAEDATKRFLQFWHGEDISEQFYPKEADQGEKDMRNYAKNVVLYLWNERA